MGFTGMCPMETELNWLCPSAVILRCKYCYAQFFMNYSNLAWCSSCVFLQSPVMPNFLMNYSNLASCSSCVFRQSPIMPNFL
jgi:hypothetical protein